MGKTKKVSSSDPREGSSTMEKELIITDPDQISSIVHEKKSIILQFLIKSEYTIRELSSQASINPGTVKRHMTDLEKLGLIQFIREIKNKHGVKLRYFRSVAEKFVLQYEV